MSVHDPHDPYCGDCNSEDRYCHCSMIDRVRADERERIAQAIEAQPIDAWGSQEPRGPVTFARREAQLRSAAIARGEEQP